MSNELTLASFHLRGLFYYDAVFMYLISKHFKLCLISWKMFQATSVFPGLFHLFWLPETISILAYFRFTAEGCIRIPRTCWPFLQTLSKVTNHKKRRIIGTQKYNTFFLEEGSLGIWWQIWWQIRHQIWWFTKFGDESVTKFGDKFGESPN